MAKLGRVTTLANKPTRSAIEQTFASVARLMDAVDSSTAILGAYLLALIGAGIAVLVRMFLRRDEPTSKPPLMAWDGRWIDFLMFCIGLFFLMLFVAGAISRLTASWEGTDLEPWRLPISAMAYQGTMLLGTLAGFSRQFRFFHFTLSPERQPPSRTLRLGAYWFLAATPLVLGITLVWLPLLTFLNELGLPLSIDRQELVDVFAETDSAIVLILLVLTAVVLAPLAEEFVFRGVIYRFLKSKISATAALVISSALFSLMHFNWLSLVPLFLLGILLVKSYEREQNIFVPVFFHGIYNANSILLILLAPDIAEPI